MSDDTPFMNTTLFNWEWAKRDKIIAPVWHTLKRMFDDGVYHGYNRPTPTVIVKSATDAGSKQALTDVLAQLEELRFTLTKVCDEIPDTVSYTPEFYATHYQAYQPSFYPDEQRRSGFHAQDKVDTENAGKLNPLDIVTPQNLKDAAWLIKVCLNLDISDMTAANGTYLAQIKKLFNTADFANYTGPRLEEKVRFIRMLDIAGSTTAIRRHQELRHPKKTTPGAAKKKSVVSKMINNS